MWTNHGSNMYLACRTICISRSSPKFSEIHVCREPRPSLLYCTQQHLRLFKLRPAMESTERNAGASAVINSLKEDEAKARSSAYAPCADCKKSKLPGFLGIVASWSHLKIGSKANAKKETTPLAIRNCLRPAPANSTYVMLSLYFFRRNRQRKAGNPVFSVTDKIQE